MKKFIFIVFIFILTSCATIPSFRDTVSSDYKKIEKTISIRVSVLMNYYPIFYRSSWNWVGTEGPC